ncbi:DUF563 domain-containing protein [Gluconobacter cerinus]|uniref:glycosyltransferase 61 family protein n=1 Tax=Gluconobacter cerinus TaxID=38307 RepID=UPI001B8B5B16|nr:glycosyltransferase 61 family protein [Gluconobacter cerinus]MBS1040413.1 DUF563 domain-containing protein [Gluconobacter cerinus]MBS1046620.1 DUF563 domain-containing protein [Gluconobacter cerinus]
MKWRDKNDDDQNFPFSLKKNLSFLIETYGWIIGSHSYGCPNIIDPEYGSLEIGRYCSFGSGVNIILSNHNLSLTSTYPFRALFGLWPGSENGVPDHVSKGKVIIGHDVWIGSNSSILPGIKIGNGAVIGANSVVTRDVGDFEIVAGNPAQLIKRRCSEKTAQEITNTGWWLLDKKDFLSYVEGISYLNADLFPKFFRRKKIYNLSLDNEKYEDFSMSYRYWGEVKVIEGSPSIRIEDNILAIPFNYNNKWGIYNKDGIIIKNSYDFRGNNKNPINQDISNLEDINIIFENVINIDEQVIYIGRINPHFGHFLINTLPRMWVLGSDEFSDKKMKIAFHSEVSIDYLISLNFFSEIIDLLNINVSDLIHIDKNIIFKNVVIPESSLMEQTYIYTYFRKFCLSLSKKILRDVDISNKKPGYYSKDKLKSGVGSFSNENEIVEIMADHNIEIFRPEAKSFRDQIIWISTRSIIYGTAGSFLHSIIFSPCVPIVVALNPTSEINSNFELIDTVSGCDSIYIHTKKIEFINNPNFLTTRKIDNTPDVTNCMLKIGNNMLIYNN